jgi:AcrR family transcriptional regulator
MAGADEVRVRATPAAAFLRAREQFHAGVRLDMGALAAELGVGRTTLYRWTGDRDRLLSDLCIADLDALIRHLDRTVKGTGPKRLERLTSGFLEGLINNALFSGFLEQEGDHGFRLVTASDGRVRPHLVAALTERIEREAERGYRPPADAHVLADGIVALGERFLYHGGNPALNPDPATARVVIRLLLRETS